MIAWFARTAGAPWAITVLAVVCAFIVGRLIVRVARPCSSRMAGHTSNEWDDRLVQLMSSPLGLVLALQALRVASPWLPLDARATSMLSDAIAIITTLAVLWTAFRGIDLARAVLERRSWAIERPSSRSLLSIGTRFAKVTVLVIARHRRPGAARGLGRQPDRRPRHRRPRRRARGAEDAREPVRHALDRRRPADA